MSDKSKFKEIKGDWFKYIISLEDKLNRNLRKIKDRLTEVTYNFLYASGSVPGILYGLPKLHKDGCPIRPILSAINTFNYNLAKFFVPILSHLTINQYSIKNSYSFVNLFTNIPLKETIDICVDQCKENLPFNLTISQLKSLLELAVRELELAVKESVFVFKSTD